MGEVSMITLHVNGAVHQMAVSPGTTLLAALRDLCDLTGTKECCAVGECGACTVMLDGRVVNSCLVLAVEADDHRVITVEGLAHDDDVGVLQRAFLDRGAVQCGFCIPGMLVSAQAVLDEHPDPTIPQIADGLSGNLCRCAGYERIIDAVRVAAERSTPLTGSGPRS